MRSMYGPDTLLLASKKPRIKELVAKSVDMTEEEIKLLNEKPDVIRGLLLIHQFGVEQKKSTMQEKIADKMQAVSKPTNGGLNIPCKIYIISTEDIWIPVGSTQLEAKCGWHWAHLYNNKILISNNLLKVTDAIDKKMLACSVYVKDGTVEDLHKLEYERLDKLGKTI